MKTLHKIMSFAAVAAMTFTSCNKEVETPEALTREACPEGYYIEELTAVYPHDPETRTAFNETTGKFAWTEGDELAFHLSNGTYTSTAIDPATSKVKLYLPVGVTRDNYAVYPASAVVNEAAEVGNMQVTLPSTYDISGNLTTDYVPMPLIATNDANNKKLKFEHVGGLLQVNLNVPAGVKTATLSMGKTITGTFDLAAGSGNGVIEAGAVSDDALTFVLSEEGLAAETSVKLLAPLPSGTYDKFQVAYDNGFAFTKDLSSKPWEFDRTQGKKVSIGEDKFEDPIDYFWFEALEPGSTVSVTASGSNIQYFRSMEFSFDRRNWTLVNWDEPEVYSLENVGDRVWFRMKSENTWGGDYGNRVFSGSGRLKVGGSLYTILNYTRDNSHVLWGKGDCRKLFANMECLVDARDLVFPDLIRHPGYASNTPGQYAYSGMFMNCVNLEYAPLILPSTLDGMSSGSGYCYRLMFKNCSKLKTAPALPAQIVAYGVYDSMFENCVSLETAPDLSHVKVFDVSGAYGMFRNCTGLKNISDFHCEKMSSSGCREMFEGCTSLVSSPNIYSDLIEEYACQSMFRYCTGLVQSGTLSCVNLGRGAYQYMFERCSNLIESPELPATVAAEECYASMFINCTSLKKANLIHITTQATGWAKNMFRNCSSLKEISVCFESWEKYSGQLGTFTWTYGVPSEGVFNKPSSLPTENNASKIPNGWTVYNLEEVEAGN